MTGDHGFFLSKSLQTPSLTGDPFDGLEIVSPTRGMRILAPTGVSLSAPGGNLSISTSLSDLTFKSTDGKVGSVSVSL